MYDATLGMRNREQCCKCTEVVWQDSMCYSVTPQSRGLCPLQCALDECTLACRGSYNLRQ